MSRRPVVSGRIVSRQIGLASSYPKTILSFQLRILNIHRLNEVFLFFFQKNVVEQFCPVFCHRDDEPVSRPIRLTGPVRPALDGSTGQPASVWLSCVCDPTIPDPAFDRKLAIYWMDRVERISCKDGKKMSELHFLVHRA